MELMSDRLFWSILMGVIVVFIIWRGMSKDKD